MGKELVFQALRHQPVERAPWVPFCGVHAGFLKGYSAKEVLQDADKLIESLHEVHQTYAPDGMPVVFDLQIEAEILGCQLAWVNDSPPMVSTHPLAADKKIPCECTLPEEQDGRLPMILQVMREMKASIGDTTALYGLITGPFTLASHLRGTDLFLDMYDDPEFVVGLLDYCAQVARRMASLYIAAGMDVIAVVDPLVSQISEEHFTEFLHDPYTSIFTDLRNQDTFSSFFVCGDATRNIEAMCLCAPDNISIDENIDIKTAKQICDKHNVTIGGNIQLTVTMLHGSQQANMQAVLNIVEACGTQNLIVSPGCDMPYATPPENVIAASFAIHQPDQARGMLEGYDSSLDLSNINVTLPEYSQLVRPLVEVFTLDSQSCAACGYMMSMAQSVVHEMGDVFDLIEYKFTVKENIKRCVEMKVKNLPSLYLNGQLLYSSLIPNQNELIEAVRKVM